MLDFTIYIAVQMFGVGKMCFCFLKVSYAHKIYLIRKYSKNSNNVKYYYPLKDQFLIVYFLKCNLILY